MKASEMRIGNYYDCDGRIEIVTPNTIAEVWTAERSWCKPFKLNEDWLVKFGFELKPYESEDEGYGTYYHLNVSQDIFMVFADDFSLALYGSEDRIHTDLGTLPKWPNISFVHSLQNLYFALTGEELIIKN